MNPDGHRRGTSDTVRLVAAALQLLTRFRVNGVVAEEEDLPRASGAFPLVGVGVAAVEIGVRAATDPLWGPVTATMVAVASSIAVTGALHEDGLADTVDGLWGGSTPQRRLEIMRDSRVGIYGVLAVVCLLALRVALLAPLALPAFASAALVGHVLGRSSTLLLVRWLPPAREEGSGALLARRAPPLAMAVAAVSVLAVLAFTVGIWAPAPLAVAVLVVAACRRLFLRRIGGFVGDALGAANQAVHVASMAVVSALAQGGWL